MKKDYYPEYEIKKFRTKIGKTLKHGEKSETGLYAIVNTKKNLVLRVAMSAELAEYLTNDDSRHICECHLLPVKSENYA